MALHDHPMTLRNEPMDGRPLMRKGPIGDPKPGSMAERLLKQRERVAADDKRRAAKRAELAQSAELTDCGRQRRALDFTFDVATSNLKGQRDLTRLEKEIAANEAKLQMPRADPTDLVGAFRRARRCDRLLGMSADERHKEALKHRDDPQFQLAIIEARESGEDLGLSETLVGEIIDGVKQRLNGPLLEEIQYDKRVLESTKSALDVEWKDIHKEAVSVDPAYADLDRFHARVTEAANLAEPLWLRKFKYDGEEEVIRAAKFEPGAQTGSWVKATPEEIENGIFAETKDAYEKLKGAAPLGAFGTGDAGRKARAEFINESGIGTYLNRNKLAQGNKMNLIEDQQLTEPDTSGEQTQTPPLTVDDLVIVAEEISGYMERRLQQEIVPALDALVKAVTKSPLDKIVPAIENLLEVIRAPKTLIFDENGKPTGVKIANPTSQA